MTFEDLPGLTVSVDNVAYDPTRPAPPEQSEPAMVRTGGGGGMRMSFEFQVR